MGQIKKIAHVIMYTNWGVFLNTPQLLKYDKVPSFFSYLPHLTGRAEILQNILVTFWAMEFHEKMTLRFTDI